MKFAWKIRISQTKGSDIVKVTVLADYEHREQYFQQSYQRNSEGRADFVQLVCIKEE